MSESLCTVGIAASVVVAIDAFQMAPAWGGGWWWALWGVVGVVWVLIAREFWKMRRKIGAAEGENK